MVFMKLRMELANLVVMDVLNVHHRQNVTFAFLNQQTIMTELANVLMDYFMGYLIQESDIVKVVLNFVPNVLMH